MVVYRCRLDDNIDIVDPSTLRDVQSNKLDMYGPYCHRTYHLPPP